MVVVRIISSRPKTPTGRRRKWVDDGTARSVLETVQKQLANAVAESPVAASATPADLRMVIQTLGYASHLSFRAVTDSFPDSLRPWSTGRAPLLLSALDRDCRTLLTSPKALDPVFLPQLLGLTAVRLTRVSYTMMFQQAVKQALPEMRKDPTRCLVVRMSHRPLGCTDDFEDEHHAFLAVVHWSNPDPEVLIINTELESVGKFQADILRMIRPVLPRKSRIVFAFHDVQKGDCFCQTYTPLLAVVAQQVLRNRKPRQQLHEVMLHVLRELSTDARLKHSLVRNSMRLFHANLKTIVETAKQNRKTVSDMVLTIMRPILDREMHFEDSDVEIPSELPGFSRTILRQITHGQE